MTTDRLRQTRRPPRGFATVTALGLIGILGVTLGALAVTFAADARRTARQANDAQVRQLLVAGELTVRGTLGAGAPRRGEIALPPALASAGATLAYEHVGRDDARVEVRVTAKAGDGPPMTQSLTYVRAGDRWELRAADL